jgi:hypothetical protein
MSFQLEYLTIKTITMEFIKDNIIWLLFFGFILFVFINRKITRRPNFMKSMYVQTLEIPYVENIETILKEVMKKVGFKEINFEETENTFYAKTSFSMSSWFENIQIKLVPDDNKFQIYFSSTCGYPYQVYDWGKNKENFEKFKKKLTHLKLV